MSDHPHPPFGDDADFEDGFAAPVEPEPDATPPPLPTEVADWSESTIAPFDDLVTTPDETGPDGELDDGVPDDDGDPEIAPIDELRLDADPDTEPWLHHGDGALGAPLADLIDDAPDREGIALPLDPGEHPGLAAHDAVPPALELNDLDGADLPAALVDDGTIDWVEPHEQTGAVSADAWDTALGALGDHDVTMASGEPLAVVAALDDLGVDAQVEHGDLHMLREDVDAGTTVLVSGVGEHGTGVITHVGDDGTVTVQAPDGRTVEIASETFARAWADTDQQLVRAEVDDKRVVVLPLAVDDVGLLPDRH